MANQMWQNMTKKTKKNWNDSWQDEIEKNEFQYITI